MSAALEAALRAGAERAARRLLGVTLVSDLGGARTSGRIVETEAYLPEGDLASHSAIGETPRNRTMFGVSGRAYVYLIYGVHHCVNVVTGVTGGGEAVLLRALEPIDGIDVMRDRRGGAPDQRLCDGPGKLCQALGITREEDGVPLLDGGGLWLVDRSMSVPGGDVIVGPRVGITKSADLPLRFRVPPSR